MDRFKLLVIGIVPVMVLVAFSGCLGGVDKQEPLKGDYNSDKYGSRSNVLVTSSNSFAFELYDSLGSDENMVFSPYSLMLALGMAYEGARGSTAVEMGSVLGFTSDVWARHEAFRTTLPKLNDPINNHYDLTCANGFWVQRGYPFLDSYLSILRNYYRANGSEVDFRDRYESSKQINDWITKETNGKVPSILTPEDIDPETVLALANAIYFKATWMEKFKKEYTEKEDFRTGSGEDVNCDMMKRLDDSDEMYYGEKDGLKMIEIPYSNMDLSMYLVLPSDRNAGIDALDIDEATFRDLHDSMRQSKVDIRLPRFQIDTRLDLVQILSDMGMPSAFKEGQADFSGIDGSYDLFIGKVVHKATITVDEDGTEASARSVVLVTSGISPELGIEDFHADHQFLFVIEDCRTTEILFMGKVTDPTA